MRHKVSLLLLYVCFCLHFKQTHTKESKAKFNYKDSKSPKGKSSNSGESFTSKQDKNSKDPKEKTSKSVKPSVDSTSVESTAQCGVKPIIQVITHAHKNGDLFWNTWKHGA